MIASSILACNIWKNLAFLSVNFQISLLKKKVEQLMVTCEAANKVKLEELIKSYPKEMQEAIINCQRYATLKDKRGMRYSKEWIAECLKLREKNPPAYLYLRKQKILALPSNAIINSYLKKMNKNCEIDAVVPESTLVGSESALDDSGSVSIAKEEIKGKHYYCIIFRDS